MRHTDTTESENVPHPARCAALDSYEGCGTSQRKTVRGQLCVMASERMAAWPPGPRRKNLMLSSGRFAYRPHGHLHFLEPGSLETTGKMAGDGTECARTSPCRRDALREKTRNFHVSIHNLHTLDNYHRGQGDDVIHGVRVFFCEYVYGCKKCRSPARIGPSVHVHRHTRREQCKEMRPEGYWGCTSILRRTDRRQPHQADTRYRCKRSHRQRGIGAPCIRTTLPNVWPLPLERQIIHQAAAFVTAEATPFGLSIHVYQGFSVMLSSFAATEGVTCFLPEMRRDAYPLLIFSSFASPTGPTFFSLAN